MKLQQRPSDAWAAQEDAGMCEEGEDEGYHNDEFAEAEQFEVGSMLCCAVLCCVVLCWACCHRQMAGRSSSALRAASMTGHVADAGWKACSAGAAEMLTCTCSCRAQAPVPWPGMCDTAVPGALPVAISELADVQGASELADALEQLDIGSPAVAPTWENGRPILRGMPQMATRPRHTRFTDEGSAVDSPGTGMMSLRGVPAALGTHIRFDNDA